jgi:CHAD domain-containing protein
LQAVGCNKTFIRLTPFAVARGDLPGTVGACMAALAPDTAPELALRQIVAGCRADLIKHRKIVLESRRAVGIHQARVALRRMRAAFSLFRAGASNELSAREMQALGTEAKWLAQELAPSRDLYVFLNETVRDVPPEVTRVAQRLARTHLERARAALAGDRYSTFDATLASFVEHVPASPGGRLDAFGADMLQARHDKVRKRGHKVASLDGRRLHRLRIAIKKLRYAAEFLLPAFAQPPFDSKAAKPYIEATARLQGALGTLNDHAVADQILASLTAASRLSETIDKALAKLGKQAASGDRRRRQKLQRAWKKFEKAERFWQS